MLAARRSLTVRNWISHEPTRQGFHRGRRVRAGAEIVADVCDEVRKTGRKPREILHAMRDEGYIECDDVDFETCVRKTESSLGQEGQ